MVSQSELNKALTIMCMAWSKQDDTNDGDTQFIYRANTVKECLSECERKNIKNVGYVLHRWYNYQTSKNCEELFVKHGAVKEKNLTHKEIDFYIDGRPYDLKITVFPLALKNKGLDLNKPEDRDYLIRWFYTNQSQAARKHFANRLFVVCVGDSVFENQWLKGNSWLVEREIKRYMGKRRYLPHLVTIDTDTGKKTVFSDVIVVKRKEL